MMDIAPGVSAAERLRRLVIDVLLIDEGDYRDDHGPDEITTWDSLANLALASAIEQEFGVAVPSEEMAGFNCIGDIRQFCRSRGLVV